MIYLKMGILAGLTAAIIYSTDTGHLGIAAACALWFLAITLEPRS